MFSVLLKDIRNNFCRIQNASRRYLTGSRYTLRRALLYVPGDDSRKIRKAYNIDVDCIALDCEDGVAYNRKEHARNTILEFLNKGKPVKNRNYDWGVRVNSVSSGLCQADLDVILSAKNLPDTISLPKVNDVEDLRWFSSHLDKLDNLQTKISVILFIETANGMMKLREICEKAKELGQRGKFEPVGLVFGADDFIADIGARKTDQLLEILYARQKLVMVAKAFKLQAIDLVYIQYKDMEGLKRQSIEGVNMGFTGKQVIHPDQVPIVQNAFIPTEKQIQWAKDLIKAYHEHAAHGKGAFNFNGIMVDSPTLKQAENLINFAKMVNDK